MRITRHACQFLLLLAVAVIAAGCGSARIPRPAPQLNPFPPVAPQATDRLPPPPAAPSVEPAYLTALFNDAQKVWRREFASAHLKYETARATVFWRVTRSKCGPDGSGPFYCPAERGVYLDTRFFNELLRDKRVGAAAQAYVVGHEIAHHIQRLVGIADRIDAANHADPGGKNARSVKSELQADCLAGVWARSAYPRSGLGAADLDQALKTAHVLGDDYLTHAAGKVVDTAIWKHGSSEQRQQWLRTGFRSGRPSACDTFGGRY